jgi:intermediate peptidase
MLDQAFHLSDFTNVDLKATSLIEKYTNEFHSLSYVPGTNWHLRFNHLVGYGAKYYAYLVSKAIAAQIWSELFRKDPLSSTAGENYRQKLLEFGGEKRPDELISSLIGFNLNTKSLVNSLITRTS